MTTCIKTGIDVLVESHNQIVHADMLRIGNCVIIKGFGKPRFAKPEDYDKVEFIVVDTNYHGSLDEKMIIAEASGCVLQSRDIYDQWEKYNVLPYLTGLHFSGELEGS